MKKIILGALTALLIAVGASSGLAHATHTYLDSNMVKSASQARYYNFESEGSFIRRNSLTVGSTTANNGGSPAGGSCNNKLFLTFRPWYFGLLKEDSNCSFKDIKVGEGSVGTNEINLSVFIWSIILNILGILFGIVGYLAIGFIIFGGYTYVLARGDPGRIAKGKNIVLRAIIGLVICILASLISSLIVNIITEATTQ